MPYEIYTVQSSVIDMTLGCSLPILVYLSLSFTFLCSFAARNCKTITCFGFALCNFLDTITTFCVLLHFYLVRVLDACLCDFKN